METKNYYYKYLKYKNKYNSIKNNKNLEQLGGNDEKPKGNTVTGKLDKVINTIQQIFVPNNSRFFDSNEYFNKDKCFELTINKIYKLSKEGNKSQNKKSYSKMMKLLQIAIDRIDLFLKCAKITFSEQQLLYTIKLKSKEKIKDLFDIPIKYFNIILELFTQSGINPDYYICQNSYQQPHDLIGGPNAYNIDYSPGYFNLSANYPTSYNLDNDDSSEKKSKDSDSDVLYDLNDLEDISSIIESLTKEDTTDEKSQVEDTTDQTTSQINDNSITRISFKNIDDTNFYFHKNGTFELKEGENKLKNNKFNLEIYINNKKLFFIETSTKENSEWDIVNLFHNEDNLLEDGSYKEVQDIKYIIINDNNKRVKINYKIKPIKVLIKNIQDLIKV